MSYICQTRKIYRPDWGLGLKNSKTRMKRINKFLSLSITNVCDSQNLLAGNPYPPSFQGSLRYRVAGERNGALSKNVWNWKISVGQVFFNQEYYGRPGLRAFRVLPFRRCLFYRKKPLLRVLCPSRIRIKDGRDQRFLSPRSRLEIEEQINLLFSPFECIFAEIMDKNLHKKDHSQWSLWQGGQHHSGTCYLLST